MKNIYLICLCTFMTIFECTGSIVENWIVSLDFTNFSSAIPGNTTIMSMGKKFFRYTVGYK